MTSTTTSKKFGHGVVIGASAAGLLAARVLAESFARVTVVERDQVPAGPESRKCVPQARHTHAMLMAGSEIIEGLFPDIWNEMVAEGTVYTDMAGDWVWFHHGVWKARESSGVSMYCQTRPFLDWHIRRRLKQHDNVSFIEECTVTSLMHDSARKRVLGVHLRHKSGTEEALDADLVVDASGRGTKAPRWLEELGYGRPLEEEIKVDLGYSSRLFKPPAAPARDWTNMMVLPRAPHETKAGNIFPVENGLWSVSLVGYVGDYPPADDEGFMAFAKQISRPEFYEALKDAEPITPIATHRVPASIRRYFEKMPRFPEGYAVLGDANCCMNPVFGQGMAAAALGADALQHALAKHPPGEISLSGSYRAAVAKISAAAWRLPAIEDLRYPQMIGARPLGIELVQWYVGWLLDLSSIDSQAHRLVLEVISFKKPFTVLLAPSVVIKVLTRSLGLGMRLNSDHMPRALTIPAAGLTALGAGANSNIQKVV